MVDGRCQSLDSSPLSLRATLVRGGKSFSSNFGAREVCIAPSRHNCTCPHDANYLTMFRKMHGASWLQGYGYTNSKFCEQRLHAVHCQCTNGYAYIIINKHRDRWLCFTLKAIIPECHARTTRAFARRSVLIDIFKYARTQLSYTGLNRFKATSNPWNPHKICWFLRNVSCLLPSGLEASK